MKSKALYLIYIFPILFLLSLAACDDMDDYSSDPKHTLWFSQDTLRMDTVLTGIPTSTRQLKVYNPHKKALLISSIILADAGKSGFRINVDGIRGDQFSDIEIAGEDSLYIFVEATLPQQDNADIRLIKDSILFQLNGIRQEVKLRAYAQDAFTFRGKVIEKDTLIASQRPILIYDSISVAPDAHLTLAAGTRLYFPWQGWNAGTRTLISGRQPIRPGRFPGRSHRPYVPLSSLRPVTGTMGRHTILQDQLRESSCLCRHSWRKFRYPL